MFEKQIASVLQRLLADFFEPSSLSPEDLTLNVWSGTVQLDKLQLKTSALDAFDDIPFEVVKGQISSVTLRADWTGLLEGNQPISLEAGDVFILLRPREWKQPGCRERAVNRKMQSVYDALYVRDELSEGSAPLASNAEKTLEQMREELRKSQSGSWGRWVVHALLRNLKLQVSSLHIRLEDNCAVAPVRIAAGVCLSTLNISSVGEESDEEDKESTGLCFSKQLYVDDISIYVDSASEDGSAPEGSEELMSSVAPTQTPHQDYSPPVGALAAPGLADRESFLSAGGSEEEFDRYDRNRNGRLDAREMNARSAELEREREDMFPRMMVRLMGGCKHCYVIPPSRIDATYQYKHNTDTQHQLSLVLERLVLTVRQQQLQAIAAHLERFTLFQRWAQHRIFYDEGIRPTTAAGWWRFARSCALSAVRRVSGSPLSAAGLARRQSERKSYLHLYEQMRADEYNEVQHLAAAAELQELQLQLPFRDLLAFESLAYRTLQKKLKLMREHKRFVLDPRRLLDKGLTLADLELTDEQQQQVKGMMAGDIYASSRSVIDTAQLSVKIDMAAVTLCSASPQGMRSEWVRAASFGHQLELQYTPAACTVDYCTNGLELLYNAPQSSEPVFVVSCIGERSATSDSPSFELHLQLPREGASSDLSSVSPALRYRGLQRVCMQYNTAFVASIRSFFDLPSFNSDLFENELYSRIHQARRYTQKQVRWIRRETEVLDLNMDFIAPLLVFPMQQQPNASVGASQLILDLGHVRVHTELYKTSSPLSSPTAPTRGSTTVVRSPRSMPTHLPGTLSRNKSLDQLRGQLPSHPSFSDLERVLADSEVESGMQQLNLSVEGVRGLHCSSSRPITSDLCDHGVLLDRCPICRVLDLTFSGTVVRTLVHVLDRPDVAFNITSAASSICLSKSQFAGVLALCDQLCRAVGGVTKTVQKVHEKAYIKHKTGHLIGRELTRNKSHIELGAVDIELGEEVEESSTEQSICLEGSVSFDKWDIQLLSDEPQASAVAECQMQGKLTCSVASSKQWSVGLDIGSLTAALEDEPFLYNITRRADDTTKCPILVLKLAAVTSSSSYLECLVCATGVRLRYSESMLSPTAQLAQWVHLANLCLAEHPNPRPVSHSSSSQTCIADLQLSDVGLEVQSIEGYTCRMCIPNSSLKLQLDSASGNSCVQGTVSTVDLMLLKAEPDPLMAQWQLLTADTGALFRLRAGGVEIQLEVAAEQGPGLKLAIGTLELKDLSLPASTVLQCPRQADAGAGALHCAWSGKKVQLTVGPTALLWQVPSIDPLLLWWRHVYAAITRVFPAPADAESPQLSAVLTSDAVTSVVEFQLQLQMDALHIDLCRAKNELSALELDLSQPQLGIDVVSSRGTSRLELELGTPRALLTFRSVNRQADTVLRLDDAVLAYKDTDIATGPNCETCPLDVICDEGSLRAQKASLQLYPQSAKAGVVALDQDVIEFIVAHVKYWFPRSSGNWMRFCIDAEQLFVGLCLGSPVAAPTLSVGTENGFQLQILDRNETISCLASLNKAHVSTRWSSLSALSSCSLSFSDFDLKKLVFTRRGFVQLAQMAFGVVLAAVGLPIACMALCYICASWQAHGVYGAIAAGGISSLLVGLLHVYLEPHQTEMQTDHREVRLLVSHSMSTMVAALCTTCTLATLVWRISDPYSLTRFVCVITVLPSIWQVLRTTLASEASAKMP